MTDALFLRDDVDVPVGGILRLDGPEGRHAAQVRRIRVGESVLVADGLGQAVRGVVTSTGDGFIELSVTQSLSTPSRPHRWVVAQALAKGGRDEDAIEAMTELGVDEVIAWQASRCVVRWEGKAAKALEKWRAKVREASKQARRFAVPGVSYATTDELCASAGFAQVFVLHEAAERYLDEVPLVASGRVLFVVGPEGGIAPDELAAFEAAGGVPVRVADDVLRASTAGVVALAQLQAMARRLSS